MLSYGRQQTLAPANFGPLRWNQESTQVNSGDLRRTLGYQGWTSSRFGNQPKRPLGIKHGNGQFPMNGGVNRKITYKWSIFHCHR